MNIREAGQHYSFHSIYDVEGVFFVRYDWLGKLRQEEYYVIIENRELSFYHSVTSVSENNQSTLTGATPSDVLIFKADFTDLSLCHHDLNVVYGNPVHRNMLMDFFWDLYINKCFTHSKGYKELRLLFDADTYFAGIVSKLIYYRLVKCQDPYDDKIKIDKGFKKGALGAELKLKEEKRAIRFYWKYLLDEKHETYYKYGSKTHKKAKFWEFGQRKSLWFNSLEEELKPVLETIRKKKYAFDEKEEYLKTSSKLLIKRYSLLDTLRYILPERLGKAASIGFFVFCALMLIVIAKYYAEINLFKREEQYVLEYDFLKILIWVFIVGFPILHVLLTLLPSTIDRQRRMYMLFPQIYLPRLLIALCSGWLIFITAEETTKIFDVSGDEENRVILGLILIMGGSMLVLMYNEIKSTAPSESSRTLIFRSIKILVLGFLMSFGMGYLFAGDVFNSLKRENHESMLLISAAQIDTLNSQLDQSRVELNKVNNLLVRLERLNVAPENISLLSSNLSINSTFNFYSSLSKGTESGVGQSKVKVNELKKIITGNVDHLAKDGVFKKLIELDLEKSEKDTLKAYVTALQDSTLSNKTLIDRKILIKESLLTYKEKLSELLLTREQELQLVTHKDSVSKKYFNQADRYIKILDDRSTADVASGETINDLDRHTYIPFNQIFNRAIIALFLGVFLQLVIQDKTITEPI